MGKKKQSRNSGGGAAGSGDGQLPIYLGCGAAAVVCLFGLMRLAGSGSGCTDPSAINFDPHATRDDGSCVGSIYSLSGVYEVKTIAAGEDLQRASGGMEFDVMGMNSLVKEVAPGSIAWTAGVQVVDELLAMRDEDSLLVISGRGKAGLMEAVYKTVDARIGSKLTWVLRKASETGMADAMLASAFDENEIVLPAAEVWRETRKREWSVTDTETRAFANPDRPDLQWCQKLTSADPSVAELNGRYVLAQLSARAEGRLRSVRVGRDAEGSFDVEVKLQRTTSDYDIAVVTAIREPTKTRCCSYAMETSKFAYSDIKVGDEVLSIGGVPIVRQGPDALVYALTHVSASRPAFVIRKSIPQGTTGNSKKAEGLVTQAVQMLNDPQRQKLTVSEAKKTTKFLRKASVNTGAVSVAQWAEYASALHIWGFKEDSVNPGFRPEILELAVPALSKAMELTLDSTEVAAIQSLDHGDDEALETIEQALIAPGAEGMRPTSQLAKIVTALLWLDRIEEAYPDSLQAYETEGWVQRSRVQEIVDLLESNAAIIRNEYMEAVRMTRSNPHFGLFFQAEKESLAERAGSWREFELWRGGHELKYCSAFPQTCDIMRQLPEATKFRGSVKFSTMEPGTKVRPHFAIANDHLRLHLGIDVPEPDETDLFLGGHRRGWEQDNVIIFDDSIIHAVQHRGSLNRTVLIVDILHPNHPDPETGLLDTVTADELREVRRRRQQWHKA